MRRLFLDVETTGIDIAQGNRIIEIAVLEMLDRTITGKYFQTYLNPQREIELEAQQVHGINLAFLQDKPLFADIAPSLLEFIRGGQLYIHNAAFDVSFLNNELSLVGLPTLENCCSDIIDTLKMARGLRPGQRNNLDTLCRHYKIDNSSRTFHGALLDVELLAEVYLAMTRGQNSLDMDMNGHNLHKLELPPDSPNQPLLVLAATAEELAEHEAYLEQLEASTNRPSLWRKLSDNTYPGQGET